ncbi:MAG: hypothetical protein MZV64_09820 [Ignavibacteriales bacterium]|nr:hypothetical protein [Ignavibacteriales bacterium]
MHGGGAQIRHGKGALRRGRAHGLHRGLRLRPALPERPGHGGEERPEEVGRRGLRCQGGPLGHREGRRHARTAPGRAHPGDDPGPPGLRGGGGTQGRALARFPGPRRPGPGAVGGARRGRPEPGHTPILGTPARVPGPIPFP